VGLSVAEQLSEQLLKLIQPKKPSFSLNMRNSSLSRPAIHYLEKQLASPDCYLTGLNLQFCFLPFEHLLLLSNGIRQSKTLVKLDLSHNGLKPKPARFVLDALLNNHSVVDVSFAHNFLDDEFACDLSFLLEDNCVIYKADISGNPITQQGAKHILKAILEKNDTVGSLGDLSHNVLMGVRAKEELN
jgi:hypothetical protein